ncbi:retrovirus-related pol polyprotein from transposon TNT 1-94 [Tanacetum coccineum]
MTNDTVCKEKASNVFPKEHEQYFKIQDLKAQLQDKNITISKLKKLIEKCKGKSVESKFDKLAIVQQPNAQRIPKPSVLEKPTPFSDSLERKIFSQTKPVPKPNVSKSLSKPVTTQILPQTARQATSRNTNPRVSTSIGVIHKTDVSRPQLRSTQMKDKVVLNNSQVKDKKTEVEDHPRISRNITIKRVYYIEGLNHNLFSVGQFCDADLEVAFRKSTYFVRDLQGNDLLTDSRRSDLYTISLQETSSPTPICFLEKASPTQAWLWHQRLSDLNFDTINLLSNKDMVNGLPKLKYDKEQLCPSCELSKAKRSIFKIKTVPSLKGRLNLLHMDLCGPMRIESVNGKKYILKKALNIKLSLFKHLNRTTLSKDTEPYTVEAARTMLSASKLPLSFWAEAVATACYTQNRSIMISNHGKRRITSLMTGNLQ